MDEIINKKNQEPNLIVFARQSFTAAQKDIFTLAVSQLDTGINVQPDLFQNKTVTISLKMLEAVSKKKYMRIKQECKDMTQKVLEISNDKNQEFEFIVPFPRIKYSKGLIELTMFADVIQSFLELKMGYSEFYIRESLSLEHFNKKRMYEMLSAYKRREINTWKVHDDKLKFYLGMDSSEYRGRPKQFATKIIGVCVKAINDKTSLLVDFERGKDDEGWFTVFTVNEKQKAAVEMVESKPAMPTDEKSLRLKEKLEEFNMRPDMIRLIVTEYQKEAWKWIHNNSELLKMKAFRNPAGVMLLNLGLAKPKKKRK